MRRRRNRLTHFQQVVHRRDVLAAVKKCGGIFMPSSSQGLDGEVTVTLGAKGVWSLSLFPAAKVGRGPRKTFNSSTKRASTVPPGISSKLSPRAPDGNDPAIEGFAAKTHPVSAAEKKMIVRSRQPPQRKPTPKDCSSRSLVHDVSWQRSTRATRSRPR